MHGKVTKSMLTVSLQDGADNQLSNKTKKVCMYQETSEPAVPAWVSTTVLQQGQCNSDNK